MWLSYAISFFILTLHIQSRIFSLFTGQVSWYTKVFYFIFLLFFLHDFFLFFIYFELFLFSGEEGSRKAAKGAPIHGFSTSPRHSLRRGATHSRRPRRRRSIPPTSLQPRHALGQPASPAEQSERLHGAAHQDRQSCAPEVGRLLRRSTRQSQQVPISADIIWPDFIRLLVLFSMISLNCFDLFLLCN